MKNITKSLRYYLLCILSYFFISNINAASNCVNSLVLYCASNSTQNECKIHSGTVKLTIGSNLKEPFNGPSFNWNDLLKSSFSSTLGNTEGSATWNLISSNTLSLNSVTVYDPSNFSISDISGSSISLYPDSNTTNLSTIQSTIYKNLNNPKNIFLQTFNSNSAVYVTNHAIPVLGSVLNHAYKTKNLSSLFTVIGGSQSLPIYSTELNNNPQNFGECVDQNNKNCFIKLGSDPQINITMQYTIKNNTHFPVVLTKERSNPGYQPYTGPKISILGSCFLNYINEQHQGNNLIGNYTSSPCYEPTCIPQYYAYLNDFFNNYAMSCLTKYASYMGKSSVSQNFSVENCKSCLSNIGIVRSILSLKYRYNIYLSSKQLYSNLSGSCNNPCNPQFCN